MLSLRLVNIGLLCTSLLCYLEWGKDNSSFLFQVEYEIFKKGFNSDSIAHLLVFLPMAGQVLLILSTIKHSKRFAFIGMSMIGVLVLMILLVGVLSLNIKIVLSTIPFVTIAVLFPFFQND